MNMEKINPGIKPEDKAVAKELLSVEEILPKTRTKTITLPSKKGNIVIQNITYGDLGLIYRQAKEDAFEFGMGVILKGLKSPQLGWGQIKSLDPQDATVIVSEIMELSGYTPKAAEAAKKYLRPT